MSWHTAGLRAYSSFLRRAGIPGITDSNRYAVRCLCSTRLNAFSSCLGCVTLLLGPCSWLYPTYFNPPSKPFDGTWQHASSYDDGFKITHGINAGGHTEPRLVPSPCGGKRAALTDYHLNYARFVRPFRYQYRRAGYTCITVP